MFPVSRLVCPFPFFHNVPKKTPGAEGIFIRYDQLKKKEVKKRSKKN
tara:strand:- start:713 stop:853 length:141 start_codon:yes stop_codon:yes gene_type:complete